MFSALVALALLAHVPYNVASRDRQPMVKVWSPPDAPAQALQAAVDRAVAAGGQGTVVIPEGSIYFNDAAFNITGAHGITVGGRSKGNATLYFSPGVGVRIQNSSNTTLHTVAIDYSPLPYVYGKVLATNASGHGITLRLDDRSLTFEDLLQHFHPHDTWPVIHKIY